MSNNDFDEKMAEIGVFKEKNLRFYLDPICPGWFKFFYHEKIEIMCSEIIKVSSEIKQTITALKEVLDDPKKYSERDIFTNTFGNGELGEKGFPIHPKLEQSCCKAISEATNPAIIGNILLNIAGRSFSEKSEKSAMKWLTSFFTKNEESLEGLVSTYGEKILSDNGDESFFNQQWLKYEKTKKNDENLHFRWNPPKPYYSDATHAFFHCWNFK